MTEIGKNSKHKTTHQDGGDDELVLTGILPGVHKTTHQDGGDDEIDATDLTGVGGFFNRGDPSGWDFSQASYAADGAWHDWDLSSIVPAGARAVLLGYAIRDDNVGAQMSIRKKGNTGEVNLLVSYVYVANVYIQGDGVCPIGSDGKLEYRFSATTWNNVYISVKGWWK